MNYNINEGIYQVQSGHRKDIAIIKCPYVAHKIEVYHAHSIKILHGAEVYWTEIRRHRQRNDTIIQGVVVGLKNCQYIYQGKQVICTLKMKTKEGSETVDLQAIPIERKLPNLDIINIDEVLQSFGIQNCQVNLPAKYNTIINKYFWVRIMGWGYQEPKPKAMVISTFHNQDSKTVEVETQIILHQLNIKANLDGQNIINLPKQTKKKHKQRLNQSSNYRRKLPINGHRQFNEMVFTIDPQNSMDIEDALSIEQINTQNPQDSPEYQIGVHISDVTSYMHLIPHKRQQIAKRGTSVYLPHKTIYMFPQQIVKLCILAAKEYRLSFSVFFILDSQGNVIGQPKFQKKIIKSIAKLSYEQAEQILTGNLLNNDNFQKKHQISTKQFNKLVEKIKILKNIAFQRRKTRLKSRALSDLYSKNQINFKLDQNNYPTEIGLKKRLESQKLIQQFMILANESVAKKLVQDYGENSLIIHHPKPSQFSISHFNDIFSDLGFRFTTQNASNLQNQIDTLFRKQGVRDQVKELLLIRAMQIQEHATYTRYLNSFKGHFGLNLDYYTHFTSPLRRFADVIVHQQLQQCLKLDEPSRNKGWKVQQLIRQIEYANSARYRNKKLKQMVIECFINMYLFKQKKKIKARGLILSIGLKSATIYVPIYHIIKEVQWTTQAQYGERDIIKIKANMSQEKWYEFQRNDSVEIEIESEQHQQIKINIVLEGAKI